MLYEEITISSLIESNNMLSMISKGSFSKEKLNIDKRFRYKSWRHLFNFCIQCQWVGLDQNNNVVLTEQGKKINTCQNLYDKMRIQLYDIIYCLKPNWASALKFGRTNSMKTLNNNIKQLFIESRLYNESGSNYDDDAIVWWDRIAQAYYNNSNINKIKIGRDGEKLTMKYEKERTSYDPKWKSIETDFAGFDILSRVSEENDEKLCIEVKTTEIMDNYKFYLTRNEYDFMLTKDAINYKLYFWNISKKHTPKLYILTKDNLTNSSPADGKNSKWKNTEYDIKEMVSKGNIKDMINA